MQKRKFSLQESPLLKLEDAGIGADSVSVYVSSLAQAVDTHFVMACLDGKDSLVAYWPSSIFDDLDGKVMGYFKICPLNHKNRLILNAALPYTSPTALGRDAATFGLGDRLGISGYAQLKAINMSVAKPVLAQQSMREMGLTDRNFDDVIDAAAWSVFKFGWREGWGADGDHLKKYDDIRDAINAGCSMITLDCSEVLKDAPEDKETLIKAYHELDSKLRRAYETLYLSDRTALSLGVQFTEEMLMRTVVAYGKAVEFAQTVDRELFRTAGHAVDFELSMDETSQTTTYCAHYFVARELEMRGIVINSLAPRFTGEFQKGIDYIGDLEAFSENFATHSRIADHFGYKISVHSGSDKFSIFPIIGKHTNERFHIKTSGTSWLQSVRVIAEKEPSLYREIHVCALEHFHEARAYYVVQTDLGKIPDISKLADKDLPALFENNDSRQLIHITYGFMLGKNARLKDKIFAALKANSEDLEISISSHILKHLEALCLVK